MTKEDDRPVVSIILVVFNGASFIAQAIGSVQGQTLSEWELVVVDDGSTDNSAEVVEQLRASDRRIRLIRLEGNVGVAKARQAGLDNVRGDWVTFLDADDLYDPRRLECLVAIGRSHDHSFIADNQYLMQIQHERPWGTLREAKKNDCRHIDMSSFIRGNAERPGGRATLGLLKPFIKRDFLKAHRIRYDAPVTRHSDFVFAVRCLVHSGTVLFTSEPLYFYRMNRASMIGTFHPSQLEDRLTGNGLAIEACEENGLRDAVRLLQERHREIERHERCHRILTALRQFEFVNAAKHFIEEPAIVGALACGLIGKARLRLSVTRARIPARVLPDASVLPPPPTHLQWIP